MTKTLCIIPGFGETTADKPYKDISKIAHSLGYKVLFFNPVWKYSKASRWIQDFKKFIAKHEAESLTVIGFSFGAYITINTARDVRFRKIIACSLSPYFKEDLKGLPPLALKVLGKRRMHDFQNFLFPKNIKDVEYIVGDKDFPNLRERVVAAYRMTSGNKKLIWIKNTGHEINPLYLESIKNRLR